MICEQCGVDNDDVMRRNFWPDELAKMKMQKGRLPALCTACCAQFPGREWMKAGLQK